MTHKPKFLISTSATMFDFRHKCSFKKNFGEKKKNVFSQEREKTVMNFQQK